MIALADPLLLWCLVTLPLAGWGLVRTLQNSRRFFQLLPLWVVGLFTLGSLVFWGALRLRVPAEPMLLLLAGVGAADLVWRVRMRRSGLALLSHDRS